MKFSLVILSVIVATVSAGVVQPSRNPLIKLPKYSIQPHLSGEGRITNGNIAEPGQFPYQAGLEIEIGEYYAWCGATLISDTIVLTAAHCTDEADGVTVFLGAQNIRNIDEHTRLIYAPKENIIVHEKWDAANLKNDISLIRLSERVSFNEYIQPAILPNKKSYSNYEGAPVVASGWGKDSDSATSVSSELRFIDVTVTTNKKCNIAFFGSITSDMICIETSGKRSTCNGDSGGPLVYRENGQNIVIGATSFGISLGCEKGYPAVFTRTTSYLDWIEQHSGVVNNA